MVKSSGLLLLWLAAIAWVRAEERLVFGVYAADKPTETVKKLRPILDRVEKRLGDRLGEPVAIKMRIASNYAKGLEDLVSGRVDFARLGPASYVAAKARQPELRILALESKKGQKRFKGIIAVRRDSAIHEIGDLKGRRFAFGNRRSTIGRYLSQRYLLKHGIRAKDLAGYAYLGRHDKVGWAVALGLFDAGALKEGTFAKLLRQDAPLRELASFPNVTKPWVASAHLTGERFEILRDSLLALGPERFLPGEDQDFDFIREAIEESAGFFGD